MFSKVTQSVLLAATATYIAFCCIVATAVTLAILPWRLFVYILARNFKPELKSFVTGITRMFCTSFKGDYVCPVNLVSVLTIGGHIERNEFIALFEERIIHKRSSSEELIFSKFRETITQFLGYPFWVDEKDFHTKNHVHLYQPDVLDDSTFDEKSIERLLQAWMDTPWNKDKSHWEILLVYPNKSKSQTLILFKWQHCLGDGFTMKKVLDSLCSSDDDSVEGFTTLRRREENKGSYFQILKSICKFPYDVASFRLENIEKVQLWSMGKDAKSWECSDLAFTKPFSGDFIKLIRKKYGVGFQTVLFSALSAALQRFLHDSGLPVPNRLLSDFTRPSFILPKDMNNKLSFLYSYFGHLSAPLKSETMVDRMRKTEQDFQTFNSSEGPVGLNCILQILAYLPSKWQWAALSWLFQYVHIVFTSFPFFGPMNLQGCPVNDLFTVFQANLHPSADLAVTTMGCPDQIRFALSLNRDVTSLPKRSAAKIARYIELELEHMISKTK